MLTISQVSMLLPWACANTLIVVKCSILPYMRGEFFVFQDGGWGAAVWGSNTPTLYIANCILSYLVYYNVI